MPKNAAAPHPLPFHGLSLSEMIAAIQAWLDLYLIQVLVSLAAGTLIYLAMSVARRQLRRLRNRPGDHTSFATLIGRTFARTTHIFMILAAARLVVGYASPPDWLFSTIRFLFTIAAVFQGAIWLREFILGLIERRTAEDGHGETLANAMGVIRILVTVALFSIAIIVVLDNLGVNVTGLVAGLGIGGIAIGLAAQGIFSDLFAALSIIFDRPFRQGETIQYDQTIGTVERIGLKSTRLRATTGEKKVISNTQLLQKEISSFQQLDHRQIGLPIGLIYQTPVEVVAKVPDMLKDIVEANGAEFVRAGMTGFGASSLDFECLFNVYSDHFVEVAHVRHKICVEILRRFASEGIEFAYPTQTSFTAAPDGTMILPYPPPADGGAQARSPAP